METNKSDTNTENAENRPYPSVSFGFFVSGHPKGQPRPRSFAIRRKDGTITSRMYDPGTAEGWKQAVWAEASRAKPQQKIVSWATVTMIFHFSRPKSHYTSRGRLRDNAPAYPAIKPDVDNLAKAVLDALNAAGVWKDDSAVVGLYVWKIYDDREGVEVAITGQ